MLIVVVPFQDQGCGSHPFHSSPRSRPSCEPILQVEVGAKQGSLYDTPPKLLETKKKKGNPWNSPHILQLFDLDCKSWLSISITPGGHFTEGLEGKIPLPNINPSNLTSSKPRPEVWTMVDLKMALYEMERSLGGTGTSVNAAVGDCRGVMWRGVCVTF